MDLRSHIGIITTMYMHVRINPAYLAVRGADISLSSKTYHILYFCFWLYHFTKITQNESQQENDIVDADQYLVMLHT